jgi:hypothetical protein
MGSETEVGSLEYDQDLVDAPVRDVYEDRGGGSPIVSEDDDCEEEDIEKNSPPPTLLQSHCPITHNWRLVKVLSPTTGRSFMA